MTVERNLEYENMQVVFLVQALLGNITANLRAVGIAFAGEQVQLTFVLYHESEETREDIEDTVFEYEALQNGWIDVSVDVCVDDRATWPELNQVSRLVFLQKESL